MLIHFIIKPSFQISVQILFVDEATGCALKVWSIYRRLSRSALHIIAKNPKLWVRHIQFIANLHNTIKLCKQLGIWLNTSFSNKYVWEYKEEWRKGKTGCWESIKARANLRAGGYSVARTVVRTLAGGVYMNGYVHGVVERCSYSGGMGRSDWEVYHCITVWWRNGTFTLFAILSPVQSFQLVNLYKVGGNVPTSTD